MLKWLLAFIPITIALEFLKPDAHTWIFITSALAIVPLAGLLGEATEQLAHRTSEGVGGLLNANTGVSVGQYSAPFEALIEATQCFNPGY